MDFLQHLYCLFDEIKFKHGLGKTTVTEVTHAPRKQITVVNNIDLTSSWDFSYRGISGYTQTSNFAI